MSSNSDEKPVEGAVSPGGEVEVLVYVGVLTKTDAKGIIYSFQKSLDTYYKDYQKCLELELSITPEQNQRLKKKIDWVILPIFLVCRSASSEYELDSHYKSDHVNYANLLGLRRDLKLTGTQFSWLAGIVSIGYFLGEYPITYAIGRYPSQRIMSATIALWGLTVLLFPLCKTFQSALVNRLFMGIFEAAVLPGQTLMTGFWYTRNEIPMRQFCWWSGHMISGILGSLISVGFVGIDDKAPGPRKWQYLYYILGPVTIAWGVVVWFYLPDSPARAWFLSPEDRLLCVKRVSENHTGIKNKEFKADQVWATLRDPKLYLIVLAAVGGSFPAFVIQVFSTQIIHEMGFSETNALLLKIVEHVVAIVALASAAYINCKYQNKRLITATVGNVICIVAAALMGYLPTEMKWIRLVAFWCLGAHSISFVTGLLIVTSNMAGFTHKVIAHAIIFMVICLSTLGAPFTVKQNEAPRFPTAMATLVTGWSLKFVAQVLLLIYLVRSNARRNKEYGPPDDAASREAGMQDMTEFQNKARRYVH
ncbi:allantoate permease [Moniliophthora roreri MCA 2997]|uniref:Allantoate permease n=1 Tax=Moniliophthora roreri (strain MCA 2997) TaxID=1381753 RepID=V2X981_MONRO|nr:allantoate permease [Moniliophthora roreri MCA 2997]